MTSFHLDYELSDDRERIDFEKAHAMLAQSYWSPGVSIERVLKAAAHSSLIVGAYCNEDLVGYARVVSDTCTFAWLCDVIVDEKHRGKGLGRALTRFALEHPDHVPMRRWILATRDAQGVYEECGFQPIGQPQRWMIYGENPQGPIG